jgi:hypothetical protein
MLWPGRHHFWRLCARRLFTGLALVAYLVTALGFPLPPAVAKDRSEPYPCMDHPCGCLSAEQCWRHCCCFTPEQKFAWAEAHGIVPPPYAERPVGQAYRAGATDDSATGSSGCSTCARRAGAGSQPSHTSCSPHEHSSCHEPADGTASRQTARSSWVLGLAARDCRGSAAVWAATGAALAPPRPLTWHPTWSLAGRILSGFFCHPSLIEHPPDRPPRPSLS